MKRRKKWLIALSVCTFAMLGLGAIEYGKADITASAQVANETTEYLTNGTLVSLTGGDEEYPEAMQVYMRSNQGMTSSGEMEQDAFTNWSYYDIYMRTEKESTLLNFYLWKDDIWLLSRSGSESRYHDLFNGALEDGEYRLEIEAELQTGIFASMTDVYRYSYTFVVDHTDPTGALSTEEGTLEAGGYANKNVTYTLSDANVSQLYYKKPSSSSYESVGVATFDVVASKENNGRWYFYGEDAVGLRTSTVSCYIDTVAPVGAVKNKAGTTIANDGYTNVPIQYTATDTGGVARLEYKAPNATSWTAYTAGEYIATTGWNHFRTIDKAGNISEEYAVCYDTTPPEQKIVNAEGQTVANGSIIHTGYIEYLTSDTPAEVARCYVKLPNTSYDTEYEQGKPLLEEGVYTFWSVDKSGNKTDTMTATVDRTSPIGTIYADGFALQNDEKTNATEISFVPYDKYGVAELWVKLPESNEYLPYTEGEVYAQEGVYTFYAVDNAGNQSVEYTVEVDRNIPAAQLYVDGKAVDNHGYTNGQFIRFECNEVCYVKLPNAEVFTPYISGTEFYKAGKYVFYGETEAGTSSGEYTIVIDRTAKELSIDNVVGGKTDGDVTITWTDGNLDEFAPIVKVTINGKEYAKGTTVYTIDTGAYSIVSEDAAGNTWEAEFSSTKKNVFTQTLQKEYYEIHDANGEYFAFTSYENAFAFAVARENSFVKTAEWTSAAWDTGIAMDAKDSVNAKNGQYFIYKKSGDKYSEVAYFTLERLNEVIAQYAKVGINDYYYWEKSPAPAGDGENLYSYSDNKTILASSVQIGENVACLLDGETFIGNIVEVEGDKILTVCDEWGNQCNYTLAVIRNTPDIEYAVGDGNKNTVTFDRTYYFKDEVRVSITDEYDEMAMFQVFDEDGNLLGDFNIEDSYLLTESGKYEVVAVNHYGKSEVFIFIISREAPKVELTENGEEKRLQILITESVDDESHLQTLEIYKSIDGNEWVLLEKDDYGRQINLDTLEYYFRTSGDYKVVITDEFRTGIDAVSGQIDYTQPIPSGILTGVENGGYTNGKVKFEWTDEAMVTLTKDGEEILYGSGDELTEDGAYLLTFANFDGYMATYAFVIDTVAPEVTLNGATDGQTVAKDMSASFVSDGVTAKLYKDGELLGDYLPDTVITESGAYRIVATDLALNSTEISFTIDKLVAYDINIYDKGLANSVTLTTTESLTVVLTKDGEVVEYTLGDVIDKAGNYALILTDELGNRVEMSFVIVNPLVKEFSYNFDEVKGFEKVLEGEEERRLNYGTLELKVGGMYELSVLVDGKLYPFTVTVDDTAPTLTMTGVENGGTTTANVVLSAPSEKATVKVCLNESEVFYTPGGKLTGIGKYKVVVTDEVGNATEYAFEIVAIEKDNTAAIIWTVVGVLAAIGVGVGVTLWLIRRRKGE